MKRNRNLDIVRALAVLAVVIYHISVITNINIPIKPLHDILKFGGEFGVTVFFILSGFAIYSSMKRSGKDFKYYNFITKRLSRILPQYYISLAILLLFTNMAVYLNLRNIGNIFSHIFLFHDWYPSFQGAISGVCWTLGVIFQFYLISPLIFYCIEKKPKLTVFLSVIFSVCMKAFIYHFVIAKSINGDLGTSYYFGLGRTIITALDTFVIGMFLGRYVKVPEDNKKIILNILGLAISTAIFIVWIYVAEKNILYSDSVIGYVWHTGLAIILGVMMYFFANIKLPLENPILKALLFISKYEYGIYIWHLLMINALCNNSEFIMQYIVWQRKITYVILLGLSIASGVLMTEIIDSINFKEMYLKLKEPIINTAKGGIVIFSCILVYKSICVLPETYNNFKIALKDEVIFDLESEKIAENVRNKIEEDKTYAYIDTKDTGYENFFELRYFLSPRKSIHYNIYCDGVNEADIDQIFELLNNLDVDYYIIRNSPKLENYFNCEYDKEKGTVLKKNKNATSLDDLFEKEV